MSNYINITKHPVTGVYEKAEYCDDYFGPHIYGVRFPSDEKVYPVEYVDQAQILTFWLTDVLNAYAYLQGFAANDDAVVTFLNQIQKEYKARWERDPIGGEGALEYFKEHVI